MTQEIHYYVHGRGRGHAVRALTLVPRLLAMGFDVKLFAGKEARPLLRKEFACRPIYSLLPGEPILTAPKLLQRALWAGTRSLRRAPRAVISDGDLPSSLAAAFVGVPVIAIGHGLLFRCADPPSGVDTGAWRREQRKAARASVGSERQLVVNFTPTTLRCSSARLVRPPVAVRRLTSQRRGGLVCYFRDENAEHVLRELCALGEQPTLFAARDPKLTGVRYEPLDRERFLSALAEADAVVSSAGCQLIAECLEANVPHLALYRSGDDEQQLNAELLLSAGLIASAQLEHVARPELEHFLSSLGPQRRARAAQRPLDALPRLEQVALETFATLM